MDLDVRDAARLLAVSEEAVYRWIKSGVLPAQRLRHQYRLNRVELQEWAVANGHRLIPEGPGDAGLHAALIRGGIHAGVAGATRDEVLAALAHLPAIPDGIDREMLVQLLRAREAFAGTGVGDGIAIPHPRDPLVLYLRDPLVLACFLAQPVDFAALDGKPVTVLFLLLSPSVQVHLQLLSKLAYVLHDEEVRRALGARDASGLLLERVRAAELARPPRPVP